ncbi:hypothetical protein TSUD_236380 [Trifolium subterraneum]|nr:hypothetical protein TSUD_236380 [Trifolium subterraneum]
MSLSVAFHHGGHFVRDWIISYKGGEKTVFKRLDPDKWTYFEMTSLVEEDLKISKGYRLWWMLDEDVNFRLVRLDEDAYEVKDYDVSNNCVANIFVEHDVDETSALDDIPNYINLMGESSQEVVDTDKGSSDDNDVCYDNENEDEIDGEEAISNSEDERGVTFDDSEDERALGLEDGFEHVETSTPMNVTNCLLIEGKSCEPDLDMGYISEELNSDDPDDSDIEKGPRSETFNMDHLNKDTEFDTLGRDANDQYYPLAFGVVENETKDSWRWFLTLLLEDIGREKRRVFISDQQKGLIQVYEEMFDRLEHRRSVGEPRPGKWSRTSGDGQINRCTRCDAEGHNAKSCKSKTINPAAQNRKRKPPKVQTQAPVEAPVQVQSSAPPNVQSQAPVEAPVQVQSSAPPNVQSQAPVEAPVQVQSSAPVEAPAKKRRIEGQFKPPAKVKTVKPKPVNPKPVNQKPVKPSGSISIPPSAQVTTSVKPSTSTSAHVKTFYKTYGTTNTTTVKPIEPKKPKPVNAKHDLSKVRRSGRNIFKSPTNNKGPGRDIECPRSC